MIGCPDCTTHSSRCRRSVIQKVYSRAAFRCDKCGSTTHYYRPLFAIFQRHCQCPVCHNRDVKELPGRDPLDRMHANPLRRLLILFGCPLYYCTFCRVQFRDWRPVEPRRSAKAQGTSQP
jgi:hypothetical protein